MYLCLKEKGKSVRESEELLAKVTNFYVKKNEIDRILDKAVPTEKRNEYHTLMKEIQVFRKKYKKFSNKYHKHCNSLPRITAEHPADSLTESVVIDQEQTTMLGPDSTPASTLSIAGSSTGSSSLWNESKKPAIMTRKFFRLAKIRRDIRNLHGRISHIIERTNMIMQGAQSEQVEKSMTFEDMITKVSVPENKHYLFAIKGRSIELQLNHHTILVRSCLPGPQESSRVEKVFNLAEQEFFKLPENPEYPNCSLLFMQGSKFLNTIGPLFFDNMPDLCLLDLSNTRVRSLPESLFRLSKLKVLLLRNCYCVEEIPAEIEKLNNLEVLDLSGTRQYVLPAQIGELTLLKHLQLSIFGSEYKEHYPVLKCPTIPHNILSKLEALESLSISAHSEDDSWPEHAAALITYIVRLERLTFLHFYFPEMDTFQEFIQTSRSWTDGRLRKFNFIVGTDFYRVVDLVPSEVESMFNESDRYLRFVGSYGGVPEEMKDVLSHATAFYLDTHRDAQSFSELGISNFQALKLCMFRDCRKLRVIFVVEETECAFECLEYLGLYNLNKLEHIWESPSCPRVTKIPSGYFKALKILTVSYCLEIQFILMESMLESLYNLEELVIEFCSSVEKIVKEEKKSRVTTSNAILLPRLRKLVLRFLPNLVSFGNGLCPSKEIVKIQECPKLIHNSEPIEETRRVRSRFLSSLKV
ncbi:hypothetical protein ABFS82_08G226000 [Erythranthe guttata]